MFNYIFKSLIVGKKCQTKNAVSGCLTLLVLGTAQVSGGKTRNKIIWEKEETENNDHETKVGENETKRKKLKGVFRLSRHLTKLGVKMSERSIGATKR